MGADHPIVLVPRCPATEDPGILSFMRLARTLTQASWVELELRPSGTSSSQTYRSGPGKGKAITLPLEAGIEFDASLRLGKTVQPATDLVTMLSDSLKRALELRSLLIQTDLLSRALETTSSSVLLFDSEGSILFATLPQITFSPSRPRTSSSAAATISRDSPFSLCSAPLLSGSLRTMASHHPGKGRSSSKRDA